MVQIPCRHIDLDQRTPGRHPDDRRHPVERAEFALNLGNARDQCVIIEHIDAIGLGSATYFARHMLRPLELAVDNGHSSAVRRDQPHCRLANPEPAAEHEDPFAFKSKWGLHCNTPMSLHFRR